MKYIELSGWVSRETTLKEVTKKTLLEKGVRHQPSDPRPSAEGTAEGRGPEGGGLRHH